MKISNTISRESGRGRLHKNCKHALVNRAIKDPLDKRHIIKPEIILGEYYIPCANCGVKFPATRKGKE